MRILTSAEEIEAKRYMEMAAELASQATCERSRCGSIIVNKGVIIGRGYNSPPADREDQRRCSADKDDLHQKVTDKTCCIHAEQRAILDALRKYPDLLAGSKLYFIRLDDKGNISPAGQPYCTICSKLALEVGIKEFILWRKEGICVYETPEYNLLSYQYNQQLMDKNEEIKIEKKFGVGVGIMILKEGKVLLGRRHEDPEKASSLLQGQGTWTMPGGKVDFGEKLAEAAAREVEEETSLKVNKDKLKIISVSDDLKGSAHFTTIGFLSEDSAGELQVMEPDEIVEWKWFDLDNLPNPLFFPTERVLKNYLNQTIYSYA